MDHYYLLYFLNESLFAAILPLPTLDRLAQPCNPEKRLPSTEIAHCYYHPMATVTPGPGSRQYLKTQCLCRKSRKFAAVPVPAPVCPLPLGFLSAQPSPSLTSPFLVLSGPLCHLLLSAFLPFTKTPNPFLLAERTTGTTECQQPQHAMWKTNSKYTLSPSRRPASPISALLLRFLGSQSPAAHRASRCQAGQNPARGLSRCTRLKSW